MAQNVFDSQVLSAFGLPPLNTSWSLSAATNTVVLSSVAAVSSGRQPIGVAFNALTSPVTGLGIKRGLSALPGVLLQVDQAYQGSTFALVYNDQTTSLFTVATAAGTANQTSLATASFESSFTPEDRRRWVLFN